MSARFALDCDGVAAAWTHHLLSQLGWPIPYESVSSWDLRGFLDGPNWRKAQVILAEPEFWRSLPVIKGAKTGVRLLEEFGHDVIWVTSPWTSCDTWEKERRSWLARHFEASPQNVIVAARKEVVRADFLIEDKPENAKKWLEENPDGQAYIVDQPYNKDTDLPRIEWTDINTLLDEASEVSRRGYI